ncbi:MAG: helix-turn-helix domain-containing protein, partial [Nanoarchaeota archaeon]
MDQKIISENFDLTETEVNIYLSLLELGEATAAEIALKNSLNRTFTYDRIDKLLKKGLVSYYIKDDKKYFKPADPSQLISLLKEHQEEILAKLKKREQQVQELIPTLQKFLKPKEKVPLVELYSTKKGIKTVLNIALRDKNEIYLQGSIDKFKETMDYYYEIWNKQRIQANIKTKVLTADFIQLEHAETDFLSSEENGNSTTFIFGNNVVIVLWSQFPVAIRMQSAELAKSMVKSFLTLWNREVKIYSGVQGIQQAYWELISGKAKTYRGYGYSKQLANIYTAEFSNAWHIERLKKGIDNKIISFDDPASKEYFGPRTKKIALFEVRFLNKDLQG